MAGKLSSPRVVAELLRRHGLRPNKRLGQHFLVDANLVDRVADAVQAEAGDTVLEVGAGLGCLTEALAHRGARVLAVEVDRGLVRVLQQELDHLEQVQVIEGDILQLDLNPWLDVAKPWKVAGNLPYVITSPFLFRFLVHYPGLTQMTLMVQREVARRMTAVPGTRDYGPLALGVQYRARVEILRTVPASVFFPPPEVDSALVRLEIRDTPPVQVPSSELLFRVVRAAFGKRRKTLRNSLRGALGQEVHPEMLEMALEQAALDPGQRPQECSLEDFARLTRALAVKIEETGQEKPG